MRRSVDVRVAVEHPEAHELGALEARQHPEDALLLADPELRLEADEVEVLPREIVLAELHGGVRLATGARVRQAERLHRAVPQSLDPPLGHGLDRKAPFEVDRLLEVVERHLLAGEELVHEGLVLEPRERDVQIVVATALAPARERVELREVERRELHDGRHRVVEVEIRVSEREKERPFQRRRRERARRDDDEARARVGDRLRLPPHELEERLTPEAARHGLGEGRAVHGERVARRHGRLPRLLEDERADRFHLALQEAHGVPRVVRPEGVRAHHLGEAIRRMGVGRPNRPHLDEAHAVPAAEELVGALHAREPAADDRDGGSGSFHARILISEGSAVDPAAHPLLLRIRQSGGV